MYLVREGRVGLDEPIETYLPGLVKGEGVDGSRITVRHLLRHVSGLPEHADTIPGDSGTFQVKDRYLPPGDLLDTALSKPATLEPGMRRAYTNGELCGTGDAH